MIDDASRTLIEGKLSEPDRNIFDGAYEAVFNHISSQYYPNFLKSDIFVNFVRVSFAFLKLYFIEKAFILYFVILGG